VTTIQGENEMNTTTINSSNAPIPIQPLAHYDPAVHAAGAAVARQRAVAGLDSHPQPGELPRPPQILQFADQYQEAMRWPIHRPEDLLALPDGITGWLLPADAEDTDVACGVWNGEVYILGVQDKRTGRKQTLLGERFDIATGQADDPEQSAV
jgi:hypothetical protein